METKVCESCGEEFGCGAGSETCWCFDLEVSTTATAAIAEKYSECLCPKCLSSGPTGIVVKYPDGRTETVKTAVRVDTQNYHEGMFDFYDERGNLLRQIEMGSGVTWEEVTSKK